MGVVANGGEREVRRVGRSGVAPSYLSKRAAGRLDEEVAGPWP